MVDSYSCLVGDRMTVSPSSTPNPSSVPAVSVDKVHFQYPDRTEVLSGTSFQIEVGEKVALLGPNGSGKSTLVLHLNGILQPVTGQIKIGGLNVEKDNLAEIRRRVGIVFQQPDEQLFMPTVNEDIGFGPRNLGWSEAKVEHEVQKIASHLEIGNLLDRSPAHLSAGQKRRVAIAGVMVMSPQVLVMDEPTAYLDPASRAELAGIVNDLDVTQLTVTHDLLFAWEQYRRTMIIDGGAIVADGPTELILTDSELLSRHRLQLPAAIQLVKPQLTS